MGQETRLRLRARATRLSRTAEEVIRLLPHLQREELDEVVRFMERFMGVETGVAASAGSSLPEGQSLWYRVIAQRAQHHHIALPPYPVAMRTAVLRGAWKRVEQSLSRLCSSWRLKDRRAQLRLLGVLTDLAVAQLRQSRAPIYPSTLLRVLGEVEQVLNTSFPEYPAPVLRYLLVERGSEYGKSSQQSG